MIPKKSREYDWTFTYEACGGSRGLTIAYLRSLLNNKGGIFVYEFNLEKKQSMIGKRKSYPKILRTLVKVYGVNGSITKKRIKSRRRIKPIKMNTFFIFKIRTNNSAREKTERDLKVLKYLYDKGTVNLKKDSIKLKMSEKELRDSMVRLSKLKGSIRSIFFKEVKIK